VKVGVLTRYHIKKYAPVKGGLAGGLLAAVLDCGNVVFWTKADINYKSYYVFSAYM
jgi:hypothetical protein